MSNKIHKEATYVYSFPKANINKYESYNTEVNKNNTKIKTLHTTFPGPGQYNSILIGKPKSPSIT